MSIKLGMIASSRATASAALLLDTYPGAAAAYSLRKLRTAYTGAAIRVRRSSDNTETDIGFNGTGGLDTTSLLSFVSTGNGFVTNWYDQSVNSLNLTQTTASIQPQIVASGSLYLNNGKPYINFDEAVSKRILQNTSINISQPNTTVVVNKPNTSILININMFDGITNRQAIYANISQQISFFAGSTQNSSTAWSNTLRLVNAVFNGASSNLYSNNTLILSGNPGTNSLTGLTFGGYPPGNSYWNGAIPEVIFWSGNKTTDLTGINTNINSYYTIY